MFIQNVSREDIKIGRHFDCGENSMLIQIADDGDIPVWSNNRLDMFPTPYHKFKEVHQFEFYDCDREDHPLYGKYTITNEQGAKIAALLRHAFEERMQVVVHCHAGICRSGAVVEVALMIGFQETEKGRIPNVLVKKKIMQALGLHYDENVDLKAQYEAMRHEIENGKLYF